MPVHYIQRVERMLDLARRHNVVQDGSRIIEIGTGWLHWEAITLRLFFDIQAVLFDVWDNRQLHGLKNYLRQLGSALTSGELALTPNELRHAQGLIAQICKAQSFDELYRLLGFQYVVESSGELSQFEDGSFDLVVSAGVLEHVKREALPQLISHTHRLLRAGGWALHSIDTSDHLSHYDTRVSRKMYLSFSKETWKRWFENEVQYVNLVQRSDWLELFRQGRFEVVEEDSRRVDVGALRLAAHYMDLDPNDVDCTVVRVALKRKPALSENTVQDGNPLAS